MKIMDIDKKIKNVNEHADQIEKQLAFVDWLKSKGLYNPMEDAHTMQKMFEVWKEKK